jgi:host factor-I protein
VKRVPNVVRGKKGSEEVNKKAREVSMATKGGVNIQDQFLNHMRREKTPVTVHLLDGKEIHGHIKSFDNFCIQLESGTQSDTLIYKHGISSITPSQVSDYKKKD